MGNVGWRKFFVGMTATVLVIGGAIWITGNQQISRHAAAASNVVIALATLALAWLTGTYATLTKKQLEHNERQAHRLESRERGARVGKIRSLQVLCQQLFTNIERFPIGEVCFGQRLPPMWDNQDIAMLKILLSELWGVLGIADDEAVKVVINLQWITEAMRLLRGPSTDRSTDRQEYDMYYKPKLQAKLGETRQGLQSLVAVCRSYRNSSDDTESPAR